MLTEFRQKLINLPREDLLEILKDQDVELLKQVNRIEWVFRHKMGHLNWDDGSPITERDLTNEELAYLIDEPFTPKQELTEMGMTIAQQKQYHIARDPVLWAKNFLGAQPRAYQILMLRWPSNRVVLRSGRRAGKSFTMAIKMLHYSFTHNDGRVIVVAPMKAQVELLYKEVLRLSSKSEVVNQSITRKPASPQFAIEFSNGSIIRFFTSGMKSGGKGDIVRGQEAHIIILDELDYMHNDDLESLYAMLQKTSEDQEDKILIGASTPTGRREKFWEMCHSPYYKEFWFPSYCFPSGQKIVMADGMYKNIEEIKVGDLVQTEQGPQKVSKTFIRDYNGELLDIVTYGNNSTISVTPEHPFASCRRDRKQSPSYGGKKTGFDWEWTKASELVPPIRRDMNSGSWLEYVYATEEVCHTMDLLELNENFYEYKPGRVKIKRAFAAGRDFVNDFPRFIDMDNEALAVIAGWYLAEGSFSGFNETYNCFRTVEWTLNKTERYVVEDLQIALDKLDAGQLNKVKEGIGSICIRIANPMLAALLQRLCGRYSKDKQVSSEILRAPRSFQDIFVRAYAGGDGWEYRHQCFDIRTTSPVLARQIRDICARLGWIPSISMAEGHPCQVVNHRGPYQSAPTWLIEFRQYGRSMLGKRYIGDGKAAFLIKSIAGRKFSGKVYNFEVENTNSYLVEGLLVHNCSPFFDKEVEEEFRNQYTEMGYRHEVEADWGEDTEGVYPRKYIDLAFKEPGWPYQAQPTNDRSFYVMGVDWDKYGAGVNIVILEVCSLDYSNPDFANKVRLIYRQETKKDEFTYTKAVSRIIELNSIFKPRHIYVDRGSGEVQVELLNQFGIENPNSGLRKKIRGVSFSETVEMRDPATKELVKKEIKPFMVDNLYQMLQNEMLCFPGHDQELYMQLISYVVVRTTVAGRPVFEASGSQVDHAHDALILACLAITEKYGKLLNQKYAVHSRTISNKLFLPLKEMDEQTQERMEEHYDNAFKAPVFRSRSFTPNRSNKVSWKPNRKMF